MAEKDIKKQANEILRMAEKYGTEQNFFFKTTFERYITQVELLEELRAILEEEGLLVNKSYVKGVNNKYAHPAINNYNRTTDSANKTVQTLIKIINTFAKEAESMEEDPLLKVLNGGAGA